MLVSKKMKKAISYIMIIVILILGLIVFKMRNYLLLSIILAILSIAPLYYKYENRKPEAREIIIIVIMCAIAVASRIVFVFLPAFKPLVAIVIISGAVFKKEAGFMIGSLSALVSNFFFGQGPWTIYQMLLWGLIGYGAGLLNKNNLLDKATVRYSYAFLVGIFFSLLIDLLTCIASGFTMNKLMALWIAAIPFDFYYAISNVIFLAILYKSMTKKLKRIRIKYGLIDETYRVFD